MKALLVILTLTATSAFANTASKPGTAMVAAGCQIVVDNDGSLIITAMDASKPVKVTGIQNGNGEFLSIRISKPKCTAQLDSKDLERVRGSLVERFQTANASEQDLIRKALVKVNSSLSSMAAGSAKPAAEAIGAG